MSCVFPAPRGANFWPVCGIMFIVYNSIKLDIIQSEKKTIHYQLEFYVFSGFPNLSAVNFLTA